MAFFIVLYISHAGNDWPVASANQVESDLGSKIYHLARQIRVLPSQFWVKRKSSQDKIARQAERMELSFWKRIKLHKSNL